MIEYTGEAAFSEADDGNIPVDIWFEELDEEETKEYLGARYRLRAGNYCPRKGLVTEGIFEAVSDNKEELQQEINKYIILLYEKALDILKNMTKEGSQAHLYYWG